MVTYAIDATTGLLRQSVTQKLGYAAQITGEPQGRYVFAAYNGLQYYLPNEEASIVVYGPEPTSGSLVPLSEAGYGNWAPQWRSLSASSTRVYAIAWSQTTGHSYTWYVTHAVGSEGQLGPAYASAFQTDDPGIVVLDLDSDPAVFYKATPTGGVTAHFVEADGSLRQMGGSHLCLASAMEISEPLAAARGFLFASAYLPASASQPYGPWTVCSWEGPRLAPRANLGMVATYAVALTTRGASSVMLSRTGAAPETLVAMRMWLYPEKNPKVGLFAMSDDGDLEPLDTVESECAKRMLFHPSGRFLYVSHAGYCWSDPPESLSVYSIDAQGHLGFVETLEGAGGAMTVTTPAVAASAAGR